jgi:hypothetical protein
VGRAKKSLKDKGIRLAKTYLEKLCGIVVPSDTLWERATQYGAIRNAFAHERGSAKPGNEQIDQYVRENPTLVRIEYQRLLISKEFCRAVLDDMERFLLTVLDLVAKGLAPKDQSDSP